MKIQKRFKFLTNAKGMTLAEVLVSAGILTLVIYTSSYMYKSYQDQELLTRTRDTAIQIRQNILGLLSNQEAWNKTVIAIISDPANAGSDMQCLNPNLTVYCDPGDSSAANGPDPIPIYDATGNKVIDDTATAGFTLNGEPCTTFDAVNGSNTCPIRVEVHWTAACTSLRTDGKCWMPQSLIDVNFQFKSKNMTAVNQLNGLNNDRFNFKGISRVDLDTKCGILCDCVKGGGIPLFHKPGWLGPDSGGGNICVPITSLKGPPG